MARNGRPSCSANVVHGADVGVIQRGRSERLADGIAPAPGHHSSNCRGEISARTLAFQAQNPAPYTQRPCRRCPAFSKYAIVGKKFWPIIDAEVAFIAASKAFDRLS